MKYSYQAKENKSAKAAGVALRISPRNSVDVCREINGLPLAKGKRLLENLLLEKVSIGRKYYTNTAEEILNLLKSAEANAEFKGLDAERLFISAVVGKGFTFMRPRRMKLRGMKRKVANLQIVLEER